MGHTLVRITKKANLLEVFIFFKKMLAQSGEFMEQVTVLQEASSSP